MCVLPPNAFESKKGKKIDFAFFLSEKKFNRLWQSFTLKS